MKVAVISDTHTRGTQRPVPPGAWPYLESSEHILHAGDVTDPEEPLPVGDPLRDMCGSIVTPHVAGSGRRVRKDIARVVVEDLNRLFSGKRVKNRVTTSMLDRMT